MRWADARGRAVKVLKGSLIGMVLGAGSGVLDAVILGFVLAVVLPGGAPGAIRFWIPWFVVIFGILGAGAGALWAAMAERMRLPPPETDP